jgi:hypothetical protein
MVTLRTLQHHLMSVLDENRTTSDQDERGSQSSYFLFLPPCTVLYQARITNALSLFQLDYRLYISGIIVLRMKCTFNRWMLVLPREGKPVLLRWRRSTVRSLVEGVHAQRGLKNVHRSPLLIELLTGNFEFTTFGRSFNK